MQQPPQDILHQFSLRDPTFVTETVLARLWQVSLPDGTAAALKVYHSDMDNEAGGFDLLRHLNGRGVARVFDQSQNAVLLEWLGGPSLGDLAREGRDIEASRQLVDVANTLHRNTPGAPLLLDTLDDWFAALFNATFAEDVPRRMRSTLLRAIRLAEILLAESGPKIPLHGDLHHDNIRNSTRGHLAFDAKGVLGDRHFELGNAFRNPVGAEATYAAPDTMRQRAAIMAKGFGSTPDHLLRWAAAQSALSLCWTANGHFTAALAKDVQLIDRFFTLIDRST